MAGKTRVAQYQADRTNQKLYFCRLACQTAAAADNKQRYQGQCETAIFHLQGALLAFLQELNHYYGLAIAQPTLEGIKAALAQSTQVSPEIQRLEQLLTNGFLAEVMRAYNRCQYAPKPDSPEVGLAEPGVGERDLIVNVVTLSNQWLPDDATIREWRQQFLTLIEQLRAGMAEY